MFTRLIMKQHAAIINDLLAIFMESKLVECYLNLQLFPHLGNGYIPTTCLREILRELDDQLTNEELDMMIEEIDSDGSGTVDFDGMFSSIVSLFSFSFDRQESNLF